MPKPLSQFRHGQDRHLLRLLAGRVEVTETGESLIFVLGLDEFLQLGAGVVHRQQIRLEHIADDVGAAELADHDVAVGVQVQLSLSFDATGVNHARIAEIRLQTVPSITSRPEVG